MRTWFSLIAVLLGVLTAGTIVSACAGGGEPIAACVDNGDCSEGEACLLDVCEPVQCLSSTQCGIREYCDDETYVCRAGCLEDTDCRAGEACNTGTNTCEAYGCRDTQLDCAIGETCNAVTGECVFDNSGHCDTCQPDPWGFEPSGSCTNRNAVCGSFIDAPDQYFCFQPCTAPGQPDACPRGYECIDNAFGDGFPYCIAFCPDL